MRAHHAIYQCELAVATNTIHERIGIHGVCSPGHRDKVEIMQLAAMYRYGVTACAGCRANALEHTLGGRRIVDCVVEPSSPAVRQDLLGPTDKAGGPERCQAIVRDLL